ncbi:uncharacterized protein C19orf57-like isoform X2 [Leptonychotes weddellii]|uniref:Uncharacterized protein C19orf57-like isoform X2 n=1 Tax=Leptonychotes weddellii TaxID=9713 RepID=A0A7F8Q8Q7_LEPWE|nr:uncharacterized protein C19orf57-like isoform X2 [Leptonychotes weddellii]
MTPVPGNGNPQPSASIDASPEWGTVPLASERASQDHLLEQGAKTTDGENREGCWVLGYHGQKGLLLSSDAEEESDQGALQETDQAVLGESPAMEPDFLPASQIRDALEAPDFEASPAQILQDEQETVPRLSCQGQSHRPTQISLSESTDSAGDTRLFPTGTRLGSCWPGTSPHADGGLLTELQLRTCVGIKACEAARMEDATDTVHGLVVELSNLNRLIMSAHRDLEAFKRISYRKARLAGKAPAPYTSKGAGNLPPGQQSWRDL